MDLEDGLCSFFSLTIHSDYYQPPLKEILVPLKRKEGRAAPFTRVISLFSFNSTHTHWQQEGERIGRRDDDKMR
jgi:hypothetical protein